MGSEYSDNDLLTALADRTISNAVLYPWQIRMLSQSATVEIFDLSHLKVLITGGSILGPTTSRELMERLPNLRFIRESYGLKETGMLTYTYPKFDKSAGTPKVPDDHLMPVGFPNMWTSFKVVDRQTGQPVTGPDLQGELCVKTCQLLPGYLGQEESILDSEGYFHTGDLGYYDNTGVIHFVEQISGLISFWMYEIAPSVLESRLLSHSAVVDAAVVAIPDKENGQIPRGFVVLKAGHEDAPACSPRTRRAAEAASLLLNPSDEALQHKEPEEIFGMKSRSRRGSQENILENNLGGSAVNSGTRGGPIPEIVMEGDTAGEELSYWLRVSVSTGQLEREVAAHPGVGEVVVRGVLPRA